MNLSRKHTTGNFSTLSTLLVTVHNQSFTVRDNEGKIVAGSIVTDAMGATFIPRTAFVFGKTYTSTVETTVTDLAGNTLTQQKSWSFSVRPGEWGSAQIIGKIAGTAIAPKLASDGIGNVVAVWEQWSDSSDNQVWANRYDKESDWGTAQLLAQQGTNPRIVINPGGAALAAWQQGHRGRVQVRRYTPENPLGRARIFVHTGKCRTATSSH